MYVGNFGTENHCLKFLFDVSVSPVNVTNGFTGKCSCSVFLEKDYPKSLLRNIYLYGNWFVHVIICEFGLQRVGHQGFQLLEGWVSGFITVHCSPFIQCCTEWWWCVLGQIWDWRVAKSSLPSLPGLGPSEDQLPCCQLYICIKKLTWCYFDLALLAIEDNVILYCSEHQLFQAAIMFMSCMSIYENVIMNGYCCLCITLLLGPP